MARTEKLWVLKFEPDWFKQILTFFKNAIELMVPFGSL